MFMHFRNFALVASRDRIEFPASAVRIRKISYALSDASRRQ
jgi:hypothetical protein